MGLWISWALEATGLVILIDTSDVPVQNNLIWNLDCDRQIADKICKTGACGQVLKIFIH